MGLNNYHQTARSTRTGCPQAPIAPLCERKILSFPRLGWIVSGLHPLPPLQAIVEPELLSIAACQAGTEEQQLLDQILENPGAILVWSHGEDLLTLSLRPRGQSKGFQFLQQILIEIPCLCKGSAQIKTEKAPVVLVRVLCREETRIIP